MEIRTVTISYFIDFRGEQQRRSAVQNTRIYATVFFNGKQVARTDVRQLSQDFTVSLAHIIPIHIIQWPDSITVQVGLCQSG